MQPFNTDCTARGFAGAGQAPVRKAHGAQRVRTSQIMVISFNNSITFSVPGCCVDLLGATSGKHRAAGMRGVNSMGSALRGYDDDGTGDEECATYVYGQNLRAPSLHSARQRLRDFQIPGLRDFPTL